METTILAHLGDIQLNLICTKPTQEAAQARVDALASAIEEELDDVIYSSKGESLERIVLYHLELAGATLATAESCTGGLLAQRLTAVPNASRSFAGGFVVYTDEMKTSCAGVPADVIKQHGAVSEPVARLLASGTRERLGTTFAISITGIAGPPASAGADRDKPVGLVYIGLADPHGTQVKQFNLTGDRERVRLWASQHALEMLRRHLL